MTRSSYPMSIVCTMLLVWVCATQAHAQYTRDTLRVSLPEIETVFLEKNLILLAQHYQVSADSAQIIQASLWDNPVLTTDQNIYANKRFFEHGVNPDGTPKGQFLVQIDQLILLGGKRARSTALAATNARISSWQLRDILRSLKLELRKSYYELEQAFVLAGLYAEEDRHLQQLRTGMDAQLQQGNIARKDWLRIQALQLTLQQKKNDNLQQIEEAEARLRILLQADPDQVYYPVRTIVPLGPLPQPEQVRAAALAYNPEYKIACDQLTGAHQNLSLQKAMAVPDLTISPSFDQNSNYTANYWGLGLSVPIPVWNRNQGNVKAARYQIQAQETLLEQKKLELQNQVTAAYRKLQLLQQMNAQSTQAFYQEYNTLYEKIVQSYRQRQISLIEFIDYHQAYMDVMSQQAQVALQLQLAKEELNFQAGTDLIP